MKKRTILDKRCAFDRQILSKVQLLFLFLDILSLPCYTEKNDPLGNEQEKPYDEYSDP